MTAGGKMEEEFYFPLRARRGMKGSGRRRKGMEGEDENCGSKILLGGVVEKATEDSDGSGGEDYGEGDAGELGEDGERGVD